MWGLALKKVGKLRPVDCWRKRKDAQFQEPFYSLNMVFQRKERKKRKKYLTLKEVPPYIGYTKTPPCYVTDLNDVPWFDFPLFLKKHDWRIPGQRINGWWTGTLTCRTGPASPRRAKFQVCSMPCWWETEGERLYQRLRDVVYLGWPIAPSYMSPNAEGWGRGFAGVSANLYSCTQEPI